MLRAMPSRMIQAVEAKKEFRRKKKELITNFCNTVPFLALPVSSHSLWQIAAAAPAKEWVWDTCCCSCPMALALIHSKVRIMVVCLVRVGWELVRRKSTRRSTNWWCEDSGTRSRGFWQVFALVDVSASRSIALEKTEATRHLLEINKRGFFECHRVHGVLPHCCVADKKRPSQTVKPGKV